MRELIPGHVYELGAFDGDARQELHFMQRKKFFPNTHNQSGTNAQEVIRALIARVKYLNAQEPCVENDVIIQNLRSALLAFEIRAARRHGKQLLPNSYDPEDAPTGADGHFMFATDREDAPE